MVQKYYLVHPNENFAILRAYQVFSSPLRAGWLDACVENISREYQSGLKGIFGKRQLFTAKYVSEKRWKLNIDKASLSNHMECLKDEHGL